MTFGPLGAGIEFAVDAEVLRNIVGHEQVHANGSYDVGSALYPKIESDCVGRCLPAIFNFGFGWTEQSCKTAWDRVINREMSWVEDKLNQANADFHGRIQQNAGPYYQVPEEIKKQHYDWLKSQLESWKSHKFCTRV